MLGMELRHNKERILRLKMPGWKKSIFNSEFNTTKKKKLGIIVSFYECGHFKELQECNEDK